MSSDRSANTVEIRLGRPWLLLGLLSIAFAACVWVTWHLPAGAGWKWALTGLEVAYALPAGYIWWQSRPRRLRLGSGGRLSLWFPQGQRLDTEVGAGATVHLYYVVVPLPQRVGFSRHVFLTHSQAGPDDFRRLRQWLRTAPHG